MLLTFQFSVLARLRTGLKPEAFFWREFQPGITVSNVILIVPTSVTATQNRDSSIPIASEDPLFAELVLEIADVFVVGASINNRRISTFGRVAVLNLK